MPQAKTARTSRKPASKSKARTKTPRKAPTSRRVTSKGSSTRTTQAHKAREETTYVYECTRPGCNYRIVRDEKAEQGQHRYDLKCPKCHHQEFRCLGAGDLTPQEPLHAPMVELDFGAFKTIGLGAN